MILIQFMTFRNGSTYSANYLVEAEVKDISMDILSRASLVVKDVNQEDMFKSRCSFTVVSNMKELEELL